MQFEGFSDLAGKRIALVASRAPWPTITGDRVRTIGMAEGLAAHGAEVVVICPEVSGDKQDIFNVPNVTLHPVARPNRGMDLLTALTQAFSRKDPLQTALFPCKRLEEAVRAMHRSRPIDAVVVQLARLGPVAQSLIQDIPVILDMVDLLSLNFQRRAQIAKKPLGLLYGMEADRLRHLERHLSQNMPVLLANAAEKDAAIAIGAPANQVHLLTNGVRSTVDADMPRDMDIMFSGNLSYEPNVRAVEILANVIAPGLQRKNPGAMPNIHIVGAHPNSLIHAAISKGGLKLHANVPSVSDLLSRSKLMVAPILAATGVQNKVLEAMAAGCVPVVTPAAVSGIPGFVDGLHGLCIHDPIDFPAAIIKLLHDEDAWKAMSQSGRNFAEQHYGWKYRVQPLAALILSYSRKASQPK